jgi:hypothetical protein
MPGWLLWTLIGLGAWFAASIVCAFLLGQLLAPKRAARGRVVFLVGPRSIRIRSRERSRTLSRSG